MIDARFVEKVEAIFIFKIDISYLERNYQYQCLVSQPIIVSKFVYYFRHISNSNTVMLLK